MLARWMIGLAFVFIVAAACVPTPGGRATSTAAATGAAISTAPGDPPSPTPSNGPTASPSFVRPTPNPSPTFLVHEVRTGDSLTSIARLYGTTARSIAYWNRARYPSLDPDSSTYEPNRIEVGWTLQLIPTEVVDEDDLPEPTPTLSPASASPDASASPS